MSEITKFRKLKSKTDKNFVSLYFKGFVVERDFWKIRKRIKNAKQPQLEKIIKAIDTVTKGAEEVNKTKQKIQDKHRLKVKNFSKVVVEKPRRTLKTAYKFDEWFSVVKNQRKGKELKAFKATFFSGLVAGVKKTKQFNNIYAFENFVKLVERNNESNDNYMREHLSMTNQNFKDAFEYASIETTDAEGGCNNHSDRTEKIIKGSSYHFKVYNPRTRDKDNNCGLKCIEKLTGCKFDYLQSRIKNGIKKGKMIDPEIIGKIYRQNSTKNLIIIDENFNDNYEPTNDYILLIDNHYLAVTHMKKVDYTNKKTHRKRLYWDVETRPTKDYVTVGENKSHLLRETILHLYSHECETIKEDGEKCNRSDCKHIRVKSFVSTKEKLAGKQFLEWLTIEASKGRFYNCYAHNGSRFDLYFLIKEMNHIDLEQSIMQLRGMSILSMSYKSHLFRDSCNFMTNSLSNLCDAYKVEVSKMKSFNLDGKTLTNEELCFYKPKLDFWEFMELQNKEPKYWNLYNEYCLKDCISLCQVWEKFRYQYNEMITKVGKYIMKNYSEDKAELKKKNEGFLLRSCSIDTATTIGGLSLKLIKVINKYNFDYKEFEKFIGENEEKYEFMKNFKRGGISHCNQPGKHMSGVISYDIASQYPASMVYMQIPVGESKFTDKYEENKKGFYYLKNLVFECKYKFKPVAKSVENISLLWDSDEIDEVYLDWKMIEYLKKYYGLVSFDVVKGLVSNKSIRGDKLFGSYVNVLYAEKAKQDELKQAKDENYNEAYRATIKLFLNSLTGKLVEDPSRYFKVEFTKETKATSINGLGINKKYDSKINVWITAGCMVYSYSKRLLFEYIRMLPNDSDDVIHVETDSIYFNPKHNDTFIQNIKNYVGEYPVKIGSDLGNVKIEKHVKHASYFLGKKFYAIPDSRDPTGESDDYYNDKGHIMKIKGIPLKTKDEEGKSIILMRIQDYEKVYEGETIKKSFNTMTKSLFNKNKSGFNTAFISAHKMTRTIKPAYEYKIYH